MTDILHQSDSRLPTMGAQPRSSFFPFPFSIWWRGKKDAWRSSKATMEEYKIFSKEIAEHTFTQRIQPIYRWRGGAKLTPIHNSNLWKVGSHVEIFGQLMRYNTTATAIWPRSLWHQVSKRLRLQISTESIDQHANQQRDIQVNSDDPHLISKSSSAHKHQDENISYQLLYFHYSSAGFDKRKSGGICSDKKLTLTEWHHVSKQPGDFVTPYPLGVSSVYAEVALHPEDTSVSVVLILQVILKLPLIRRLQFHATQPRQQIIPDLHRQFRILIFPYILNI